MQQADAQPLPSFEPSWLPPLSELLAEAESEAAREREVSEEQHRVAAGPTVQEKEATDAQRRAQIEALLAADDENGDHTVRCVSSLACFFPRRFSTKCMCFSRRFSALLNKNEHLYQASAGEPTGQSTAAAVASPSATGGY